ncbi:MAG TPA: HD domain-containing phosphohydrolase [Longimicrobiaceae bacterium]|nr:HD domain-containing phosphohydrolase [Longimicrobiaceae bacterium]
MNEADFAAARILAADDEEVNLRLMRRVLERAGIPHFTGTTDPERVVELFQEVRPDLVVLDLHMPPLHGMEVLDRLRPLLQADGWLPVLVVSGDGSPTVRQRALAGGARDFIAKPYDPGEAVLRIRNLLEMRFLHRAVREQNRTLERAVALRTRELERAQVEVLERLAQAAELHDDETGEHVRRVAALAARIARAMGLDEAFADALRRAGALHDVGKIGIPDAILRKPGALTPAERARMNEHTTIGAAILAGGGSELMAMAERIARAHHERWDGRGYPAGLAGEAIPLEARIVAVADFYDALTHDRPYRRRRGGAEALAMVRHEAGHHFDARVVAALLALEERETAEAA